MTHAGGHLSYLRDDQTSERGPVRSNRRLSCAARAISPVRTIRTPHQWQGVVNLALAVYMERHN